MSDAAANQAANWFPVITLLLGFVASSITEYLRDRRTGTREMFAAAATSAREREAREAERRLQLFERRSHFQRDTLLSLQDTVLQLARSAGRMHHLDEIEYKKTGQWGRQQFPEDLNMSAHEAGVKVLILSVRVRDEVIREMMEEFRKHANRLGICRTPEESQQALNGMLAVLEPLNERIGMILRKLDDEEELIGLEKEPPQKPPQ